MSQQTQGDSQSTTFKEVFPRFMPPLDTQKSPWGINNFHDTNKKRWSLNTHFNSDHVSHSKQLRHNWNWESKSFYLLDLLSSSNSRRRCHQLIHDTEPNTTYFINYVYRPASFIGVLRHFHVSLHSRIPPASLLRIPTKNKQQVAMK